jgi:hypothetical protein
MSENYHDADGNPIALYRLVREDPEWAISRISTMDAELTALREENKTLRECLEGMCWQYGDRRPEREPERIGTMGMANLEWAFELLGWDDPHIVREAK